ncbi:uncharacterized protein ACOB8E_011788 isoform 1-T1 [Sarcophilus harrisii]
MDTREDAQEDGSGRGDYKHEAIQEQAGRSMGACKGAQRKEARRKRRRDTRGIGGRSHGHEATNSVGPVGTETRNTGTHRAKWATGERGHAGTRRDTRERQWDAQARAGTQSRGRAGTRRRGTPRIRDARTRGDTRPKMQDRWHCSHYNSLPPLEELPF